jgi:hypothetical protein
MVQEFDLEIKDKKGVENFVADHLSRMQFENLKELPINDSLRDDMRYGINRSDPWYAILLILWFQDMYHQEQTKGNSSGKVVLTYGMIRTSFESAQMACSGDVYLLKSE